MMKKILLLGCFLNMITSLSAQTLAPGDIAIIGTNYDEVPYEMTIVNLAPIPAGTVIRITDYGYDETTGTFGTASVANSAEGSITWTLTSAMPAGTVTKFSITGGTTPAVSGLPGNVNVTGWTFTTPASCPVPSGGDNWFIFQGNSPTFINNFIFAWTNTFSTTFNAINQPAGQFNVSESGAPNNNNSYLPPSLTLGSTAIALNRDPSNGGYHGDNNVYTGRIIGTKAEILSEIGNVSKWSRSETVPFNITPGAIGSSFPGINPIFTLPNSFPTDQNFNFQPIDNSWSNTFTDIDGVRYTGGPGANRFASVRPASDVSPNPAFSGRAILIGNNVSETGGYAEFFKIDNSTNFKLASLKIETYPQSGSYASVYTIIGYDNGVPKVSVDVNMTSAATYGSGNNAIVYSNFYSGASGARSGLLTFGSSWENIDQVRFQMKTPSSGYYWIGLDDIDFEPAVTAPANIAPTDITLSASTVNENVAANTAVGTLSSTDPDAANTFTYTLVAGTGDTDNAAFNISGSNLRITASPDFETKSSYSVRVRTADQGGLTFEKAFTITINNVNETPTDIALSASSINENVAANSTIGTLNSTDADAANTFTYTLVAGTGDTDNTAFNISGSNLRITASPDFETKASYAIRLRTADQGGLSFEKTFTINVNNLNEAPTDITLSATAINENVAAGTTVGTLSSTDVDAANTFTYTLVAGTGSTDNSAFNISGSSLRITASPDFETKSSYSVRIRTTDQGSLFFEKQFTITINNVNETPTDIALSASAINENVAANSTIGALSSTDADAANTFTYSLVAGAGSTDNASFSISGSNLTINASPNFETKNSYSIRVRTTDQGSLFFEKQFTISITNVNETPTNIALSASSINENVAANSTIGTLSSTDADAANTFTYTLVAGTGDTDNTAFNISGSNLRITASPDFETKSSYSVRVRTTDQGGLTFEKAFTITINNVNETPTDIALSASSINENVAANSTIGTLSSTDADAANTFTYTLVAGTGSTDNSAFNISGSNLRITASPDFETKASYAIRLRTADQGGLSFEKTFTINVNNLNEAPTDITLSATAINENVAANSTIGTLSSTDADAANTFTYTLVAGTGDTDNTAFNISGSNLRITASPDFETKSSYSVRVRTADQGGLTFEKAFTITINNVNETPTDIALSASSINENVAANSTIGTLSSTDADAANTFTYTLVAGTGDTDNTAFNISGSNLRITASPDFETKSSYSVRVRTTDQGGLTFEKAFTITINNVNETPTDIALSASSINENVAANTAVGTLSSTDADAANTFTYTLVAGTGDTDNASFNISGSNLRITASPDFETKSSYSVRVRTTDQGGLTFEKAFTISINDLCDLDNTVTQSSGILTATQTGASYQWYNCLDNSLVGTNSNTFTPTVMGDYKVDITSGSCTVTSTCITVTTLGNTSFETSPKFVYYPNPSNGIVNINSEIDGDFQIINQLGQTVKNFKVEANITNTIEAETLTDGVYFIKPINQNKSYKLIIKK